MGPRGADRGPGPDEGPGRGEGPAAGVSAFFALVRAVAGEARALGLSVPAFRSPPRRADATRTLRRTRDGGTVVAVALAGRAVSAVADDVVEGVIAANGLAGEAAAQARERLLAVTGRPLRWTPGPGGGNGQTRPP